MDIIKKHTGPSPKEMLFEWESEGAAENCHAVSCVTPKGAFLAFQHLPLTMLAVCSPRLCSGPLARSLLVNSLRMSLQGFCTPKKYETKDIPGKLKKTSPSAPPRRAKHWISELGTEKKGMQRQTKQTKTARCFFVLLCSFFV